MAIGLVSFAGPFVVAMLVALGPLGWGTKASLIAGTALSTTSLAVVYAVLVETGLNRARVGKLIMSACFVTDMCTVIALSVIFIKPTVWFPVFLVVSVVLIVLVLAAGHGRCALGDRPDRDRATLVLSARGRRASPPPAPTRAVRDPDRRTEVSGGCC